MHQKVSNKLMVSAACVRLNAWARAGGAGDLKTRLKSFRDLNTGDAEMCFLLVESLVIVSHHYVIIFPRNFVPCKVTT